jgi:hypothetical protein
MVSQRLDTREHELETFMHCCGSIVPFMEDFIEAGLIDAGQFKGAAEIEHLHKPSRTISTGTCS